jgi:hypothetical protein
MKLDILKQFISTLILILSILSSNSVFATDQPCDQKALPLSFMTGIGISLNFSLDYVQGSRLAGLNHTFNLRKRTHPVYLKKPHIDFLNSFDELLERNILTIQQMSFGRKKLKEFQFTYFVYQRPPNSDPITEALDYLLEVSGGGFASHLGNIIIIDGDLFPKPFWKIAAIHEFGELLFKDHFKASILEYVYASKSKLLMKYLSWLIRYHPTKLRLSIDLENTPIKELPSESLESYVKKVTNYEKLKSSPQEEAAMLAAKNRVATDYMGVGIAAVDIYYWADFLPKRVLTFAQRIDENTTRAINQIYWFHHDMKIRFKDLKKEASSEEDIHTYLADLDEFPVRIKRKYSKYSVYSDVVDAYLTTMLEELKIMTRSSAE